MSSTGDGDVTIAGTTEGGERLACACDMCVTCSVVHAIRVRDMIILSCCIRCTCVVQHPAHAHMCACLPPLFHHLCVHAHDQLLVYLAYMSACVWCMCAYMCMCMCVRASCVLRAACMYVCVCVCGDPLLLTICCCIASRCLCRMARCGLSHCDCFHGHVMACAGVGGMRSTRWRNGMHTVAHVLVRACPTLIPDPVHCRFVQLHAIPPQTRVFKPST